MSDVHERCRDLVLGGDSSVDAVLAHVSECQPCADLAERVVVVRRIAATLAARPAAPDDLADRAIASVRDRDRDRVRVGDALWPRIAMAAAAVLVLALAVVPGGDDEPDGAPSAELSDGLLVAAQRTQQAGSARLRIDGTTTAVVSGERVRLAFHGTGELADGRLHYRGVTDVADAAGRPAAMVPFEVTVVGSDAWVRRSDGTWVVVDEPVRALAPLVLDAGSVLELLRLPKHDLRLVATDDGAREVSFSVAVARGLGYDVTVWLDADDLLRRVDVRTSGAAITTTASMRLYGFGQPVSIHPPPAGDVSGVADAATFPLAG
ncbi:MAG TPA: hypothetical protein VF230_05095 [Acidimicrobiales bacterium]